MLCFTLPPSGNSVPIPRLLSREAPGPRAFTASLAVRWGVPADRILAAGSGSAALYALLRGISATAPDGAEAAGGRRAVAVPAWSCPSVPEAVIRAGLDPVPVDLDPSTLGYDTSALLEARARGLLAVILPHYFALPHPLPPGDWEGTAFLRDCAQDFDHRPEDGLPCFYSFGRGKALNAGHGGALCVPAGGELRKACVRALAGLPESAADPRPMAVAINLLSEPHMFWALSRLPGLGLGRTEWHDLKLERLSPGFEGVGAASLEAYASCRAFYRRLVAAYGALLAACDGDLVTAPEPSADGRLPTRFPVLARDPALRETLLRELGGRFGGVARMYPGVLHDLPGAPAGLARESSYPGARRIARELLTLPITAELKGREAPYLECLTGILRKAGALRKRIAGPVAPPRTEKAADAAALPSYMAVGSSPAGLPTLPAAGKPEAGSDWSALPAPVPDGEVLAGVKPDRRS